MRIGIDARLYGTLGKGLGRYISELLAQLEQIDQENDYVVFLRAANFNDYQPKNPRFRKVLAEYPWYGWREQLVFPFVLRRQRFDLVHFPHFNVPLLYRRPFVVTVHDLIMLRFPTAHATTLGPALFRLKFLAYRLVIARALRAARTIITVSQFSARDLVEKFPFVAKKDLLVTHEACSPNLSAAPLVTPPRVAALQGPFALYVGNAYPHKNLEKLLSSFRRFREEGHAEWRLTLVGSPDYFYGRLREAALRLGLGDAVVFFGRATDEELAALYRAASFYVFPSLFEGFGLPPLEAMCHGLPVASSDATCLPEILGDAALYFDGRDEEAIAGAMARLADDKPLRAELAEKGHVQCAKYDWRRLAEETLAAYKKT